MTENRFNLAESQLPTAWFNIVPSLPQPPGPPLHPGTGEPVGPDDLAPLFPAVVPTSLGGLGLGLGSLAQGTRILAHGCPATAWTLSFLMLHAWLLAKFPPEGRAELFAPGPAPFAPAPLAPTGSATAVDGGFMVNGRWEWATAVWHCLPWHMPVPKPVKRFTDSMSWWPAPIASITSSSVTSSQRHSIAFADELRAEVAKLRSESRAGQQAIAVNTGAAARTLKNWDGNGQPPVREDDA